MSHETRRPAAGQHNWFQKLVYNELPLESETSFFILVNVLDFFMTYWMLAVGGFEESNPLARYFLESWGLTRGLLMYKLSIVTFVCLISQIVAMKKLDTARWLLRFGSAAVLAVVIYSLWLYMTKG